MDKRSYGTPLGEVWLWGRPEAVDDAGGPVVLMLPGVFAHRTSRIFEIGRQFPGAAVLMTQLPGYVTPALASTSVSAFAAAFDHVVTHHLGGRPVLVLGQSVGGLVGLQMAARPLGCLALDPPLRPDKAWPMEPLLRDVFRSYPQYRGWMLDLLGFTGDGFEVRDYTALANRDGDVLAGSTPLMPRRNCEYQPSYMDEPERQLLRASPTIRLTELPHVGHDVLGEGGVIVIRAARAMLAAAR